MPGRKKKRIVNKEEIEDIKTAFNSILFSKFHLPLILRFCPNFNEINVFIPISYLFIHLPLLLFCGQTLKLKTWFNNKIIKEMFK